jgi:hypothetical protein
VVRAVVGVCPKCLEVLQKRHDLKIRIRTSGPKAKEALVRKLNIGVEMFKHPPFLLHVCIL